MSDSYEAEIWRTALGFWTYRVFLDGKKVDGAPLAMKVYGTRDQAATAARANAQLHRDITRGAERIALKLNDEQ